MESMATILDDAKEVVAGKDGEITTVIVWNGSTTFNIYDGRFDVVDVFSVSDINGKPVSREKAIEHMRERLKLYS